MDLKTRPIVRTNNSKHSTVLSSASQSSESAYDSDPFIGLNKLVKFDCSERVGAPRGTSRSSGELAVHINTPRELCCPIINKLRQLPKNTTKSLTSKCPARFTLRLETACFDEIGS